MTYVDSTFTPRKNTIAMSKNAIHNFNLSIKNSADIKSSEHLTEAIIKELAKVSKEINQQKDIVQVWQEQQIQNTTASVNNSSTTNEEGANSTLKQVGITSSVSETTTSNASIGEGVADTTGSTIMSSPASVNTTSPTLGAGNSAVNFSNDTTTQTYANVAAQQTLAVPQMLQANSAEPTREAVIAEIEKKLTQAIKEKDFAAIAYWTSISKAFGEEAKVQDFDGKPNNALFTDMYAMLKQSNQIPVTSQNFNWEIIREKMVESIDNNILKGKISQAGKNRWEIIKNQLKNDTVNVANLFERYNELFLLLKEVEGLEDLPNTITITTKTKIYPNLTADRLYAEIGKENVYVFLKEINSKEITGSAVNKGAVKIKNSDATKFIVGESLEFILDEVLVNDINFEKKDINWIVYKDNKKQKIKDQEFLFINEGTSFSYNFDTPGKYKVEAYGKNPGSNSNNKKNVKLAAFVEVEIIAQEITIVPPAIIKTNFVRPFTEEQSFKVTLKNPEVKTLNPLKLYYQIAYTNNNKVTTISEEQELDSAGIVKLTMPNLGEYSIKVVSKDQYGLSQKQSVRAIKNAVISIDKIEDKAVNDVYLWSKSNQKATFKVQNFRIDPTQQEKQNVKWLIYDNKGNLYVPDGLKLELENNDAEKPYFSKGESFAFPIPKIEGEFTVEAYNNIKEGSKSKSTRKIFVKQPQVIEAYWTYNDGNKKKTSGFMGEINHIKASIPGYVNQRVRINFFLNDSKVVNYHNDTKTNGNGEINKILKFDASLQKHFGLKNGKTAKIRFELEGIQNGNVPYLFKENANAYKETSLNVTTSAKITDAYFMYDGNRVNPFTQVPYGAKVTGIVKTLNMVGKAVNLKIYKDVHHPKQSTKVIVDNEGVAVINFTLNKNWKEISVLSGLMDTFYIGIEGVESKISLENGLNAIVLNVKHDESKKEKFDENNPLLVWGAKVNKDFRVKVVQICKRLWPKNTLEMANGLMAVMNRETGGTFAPHQIEGKKLIPKEQLTKDSFITYDKKGNRISHAVGLVQFTQKALTDMGEYNGGGMDVLNELKLKYANMTQLEQLVKVEKYMNAVAILPTIPEEIYMAVFAPAYVGKGLDKTIYEVGTTYYDKNDSLDVNTPKDGIQIKELIDEYYISLENGKYGRNIWRNPLDKMELRGWYKFGWSPNESDYLLHTTHRSKGKHLGLDLYAPIGTPVYACVDGTALILFPPYSDTFGLHVRIEGYYNEKKYNFFYAHLSEIKVKNFQKVKAGTLIGYTGQTGEAEGQPARFNHLHFEVRNSRENRRATLEPLKEISDLSKNVNINPLRENQKG